MGTSSDAVALGLDIGGSSIKFAVLNRSDNAAPHIRETGISSLESGREPRAVLDALGAIVERVRRQHGRLDSISVGIPGIFDHHDGKPTLLPNFPDSWNGYPLRDQLGSEFSQSVSLVNDAKAFSVAESLIGAGVGKPMVVCIVLGTGVGGGIVKNGKLWTGMGSAGELGHLIVDLDGPPCGCGGRGCVESYASAAAIARNGGRTTAKEVFDAALGGDDKAMAAIALAIRALAAGIASVFVTLAPSLFVVGGGLADAGDQLIDPLREEVRRRVHVAPPSDIHIVKGTLGRHAGAIGAALVGTADHSVIA